MNHHIRTRARRGRTISALLLGVVVVTGACGGSDPTLQGAVIEPAPDVSALTLPDALTGEEVAMQAPAGEVRLVYFGYTNCPDVCPTTLAHVKLALNRIGRDDAARVSLVMATVDPKRDTAQNLQDYVDSFVSRGHALRTLDDAKLRQVADKFGVSYSVTVGEEGRIEVAHTGTLYAVNDAGRLVDQWPFDAESSAAKAIANDLEILLDRADA